MITGSTKMDNKPKNEEVCIPLYISDPPIEYIDWISSKNDQKPTEDIETIIVIDI